MGTGVRGGKIRPEYILILSESILVTLLRFDGARELFLAVVFVSGRFFKCAYCVRPAGRCPSVQHPAMNKIIEWIQVLKIIFRKKSNKQNEQETNGSRWCRLRTWPIPLSVSPLATEPFLCLFLLSFSLFFPNRFRIHTTLVKGGFKSSVLLVLMYYSFQIQGYPL